MADFESNNNENSNVQQAHTINNYGPRTSLKELADSYEKIDRSDIEKTEFIEDLQSYLERMPNSPRELNEKLTSSNRSNYINEAEWLKERFAKKLDREAFHPTAQRLFAHILANIHSRFNTLIKQKINEGLPVSEIDRMVYENIVNYIYNQVGSSKLTITPDDIRGMLYHLAGQCFIDWDKQ